MKERINIDLNCCSNPFQGLHRHGKTDVPKYDGSWAEWGAHLDTYSCHLHVLNVVNVTASNNLLGCMNSMWFSLFDSHLGFDKKRWHLKQIN